MERTAATVTRERNGHIQLNSDELDAILEPFGYKSLRAKARWLGVGLATLQNAYQGGPVGWRLIYACRIKMPKVGYERLFREVQS